MKIEIGSYEAKTKLPELLRQVKSGKSFTITNRGEAIADLVPSAREGEGQGGRSGKTSGIHADESGAWCQHQESHR